MSSGAYNDSVAVIEGVSRQHVLIHPQNGRYFGAGAVKTIALRKRVAPLYDGDDIEPPFRCEFRLWNIVAPDNIVLIGESRDQVLCASRDISAECRQQSFSRSRFAGDYAACGITADTHVNLSAFSQLHIEIGEFPRYCAAEFTQEWAQLYNVVTRQPLVRYVVNLIGDGASEYAQKYAQEDEAERDALAKTTETWTAAVAAASAMADTSTGTGGAVDGVGHASVAAAL